MVSQYWMGEASMGSAKTILEPAKTKAGSQQSKLLKWVVPIALGLIVYLIPAPAGLSAVAWRFFALFITVIAALITEPLPGAAIGFIGVAFAAALVCVGKNPGEALRWALSGYANSTVWLIYAASLFALGYEVTGLGRRIALALVKHLGRRTLGLGYAVALADLVLAPFTSSNTARCGSVFPIVSNIPPLYGSSPTENPRKIGAYIMWTAFAAQCVSSAMFLTALAPNVLAVELARKVAHIDISWTAWFYGFLPLGIALFLAVPLLGYWVYPPELKRGDAVADWAGKQLADMGPFSVREWKMSIMAIIALGCWIGATKWITPEATALCVCSLMLLTGVIQWSDIAANKQGWTNLVWLATLVTMADGLAQVGFLSWFAKTSATQLSKVPVLTMMIALVAIFYLIHYFFASLSAHTTALLPVFLAAMMTLPGLPIRPVTMVIGYTLGLMGILTPYATGPAPIYFGAGYIKTKEFWRLGFIFGMFFLAALLLVQLPIALRFLR
jgi:L-tartrate/succinate antiporter